MWSWYGEDDHRDESLQATGDSQRVCLQRSRSGFDMIEQLTHNTGYRVLTDVEGDKQHLYNYYVLNLGIKES